MTHNMWIIASLIVVVGLLLYADYEYEKKHQLIGLVGHDEET